MTSRRSRPPRPHRDPATRLVLRVVVFTVLVVTAVSFLPVRTADYVQDDHLAVEENAVVARGDLAEIFSTHYWAGARGADHSLYRPVTILSYAVERRITSRPSAAVSHAVNLGLHVGVTLLLLAMALRIGSGWFAASAAALLFAVHPVHVEAVAGIVGRAEILATMFGLASILAYSRAGRWRADTEPAPWSARAYAWSAAAALFLAAGSKEIGLAAAALLPAVDLLFRPPGSAPLRRWLVERAAALAPSVLALTVLVILRIRALQALFAGPSPHPVDNPLILLSGTERIATALGLVVRYARLLCFPVTLSADYSGPIVVPESSLFLPRPAGGLVLLALVGFAVVLPLLGIARRLDGPGIESGASARLSFAALVLLLPYLVIGNLLVPIGVVMAERLLYFPSAGFCLGFGLALALLAYRYPAFRHWRPEQRVTYAAAIGIVLVASFSLQTYQRCSLWQDDASVFGAAARTYPQSPRAQFILGKLKAEDLAPRPSPEDPRVREALERFDLALAASPQYVPAWAESGVLLARCGRLEEALQRLDRTLELSPSYALAHLNRGIALQRLGRPAEARRAVRKALLHEPDNATAWAQLGNLEAEAGRNDAAIAAWTEAMRRGRTDLRARIEALRQR